MTKCWIVVDNDPTKMEQKVNDVLAKMDGWTVRQTVPLTFYTFHYGTQLPKTAVMIVAEQWAGYKEYGDG